MKKDRISTAVIRRLPRYYRRLDELYRSGTERISSSALGDSMGLTASQIRQDLSCFGEFGQQGYGYNVESLRAEVADILGTNNGYTAVLVGLGNLGRALVENFHFSANGFKLLAAFDIKSSIVGTKAAGIPILHARRLEEYLAATPVNVGVLTVPQDAAHSTAERLVHMGVRGIWNFTNTDLNLSMPGVVVENVHFADSLLTLSYLISEE